MTRSRRSHQLADALPGVSAARSKAARDDAAASRSQISIAALASSDTLTGKVLQAMGPMLDRLLGIDKLRRIYEVNRLLGLSPQKFVEGAVDGLGVRVSVHQQALLSVPASGPVLLVCNHPYGGVEALILLREILKVRSDVKILGNQMLRVFPELDDVLIGTNPLASSQKNLPSLRQSLGQLKRDGVLVLFPAGRVSYFRKDLWRIADHPWHRLAGYLMANSSASLVPAYFGGSNSRLFQALGFVYSRLKIALLPRELLKLNNRQVDLTLGRSIENAEFSELNAEQGTQLARLLVYLHGIAPALPPSKIAASAHKPIAAEPDRLALTRQIARLPESQVLSKYRDFIVCFMHEAQAPDIVREIARQRERTFRLHDEGSGQAIDTDDYDAHYVHLLVWDNEQHAVVGAYRMGQTDRLLASGKVYLAEMFNFDAAFYSTHRASLELGRSFVAPEYQKKHYALHLLWKGIGAYLRRHPHYDRLYGTVSLSRQYSATSVAVMCNALIQPDPHVTAKNPMNIDLGPEWADFIQHDGAPDLADVGKIVRCLEGGERDLPVLLKHYHKVGARFLAVSIDRNFNNTPGLLLSVDINALPEHKRKLYVDDKS